MSDTRQRPTRADAERAARFTPDENMRNKLVAMARAEAKRARKNSARKQVSK